MTPAVRGRVTPGFEAVRTAFEAAFDDGEDMGAALAIRHRGVPVVDLWGGVADARTGARWREDTASVIFSCTKGLMSIVAARLVQEGRLDYDARVAVYWPEFARAGKGSVTVGDILSHRAGLSAPRSPLSPADVLDWDAVTTALAGQEPLWEPGTAHAYHALTHGWLIGEVVRRVTGQGVGRHFAGTVADPLGADAWIGLPEPLHDRVAHLTVGPTLSRLVERQARARTPGVPDWPTLATTLGGAFPLELAGPGSGFNDPAVRTAEIPGAGGIATARALAAVWSATITETDGVRLLDDATLRSALEARSEGQPFFAAPGPWARWAMGFQLDSAARRYVTARGFGHDGAGGQVAFADPGAGVGFAFLTNRMEAGDDPRATRIVDALRSVLGGAAAG
ncbi:serine hydrolase domain-containing protein [Streptomyces radicis]|uniref:Class A beta-lactamase-related serine hydrolase n=1 Tax=Streptomyces radicis TaxID=1750517 RepID=A0A3A9WCB1_9ACTN|nr:serine hydrolase domain-containing protein [Streptomyces radicis]RKN10635.1 class A beta-lactamase-related serine hydrolase [Streptomyces radicis]RKN24895.1 class A beta-lactamase-related serine hydrolase [Streptomyces radicis]